ncbi:NAD-dependent epimerase/dehydratase family protein [Kytococcus sedentarius]|uniref:NAD-dependent epimerase/dehydratase family protein n=1 Tax=Kytococcus sedentarius TaxID=1276 RepID=UPI0035BC7D9B
MRVLVTGAAGNVGRVVVRGLLDLGHEVVGVDRSAAPDDLSGVPWHAIDCADPRAVDAVFAAERLDAVVHLAAHPVEADLPTILTSHLHTAAAVLEAMVAHDVRRVVFASSNHAVGRTPRVDLLPTDTPPRPDTFYGVGKVAVEALLQLYVDRFGIDAVACRIGSMLPEPTSVRALSTWLSPADAVRMVHAALTTPSPGFAVLYGASNNTRGWWDLEPGRALGYHPQDDAEAYADRIESRPQDEAEGSHVGGPFAMDESIQPAFGDAPGD